MMPAGVIEWLPHGKLRAWAIFTIASHAEELGLRLRISCACGTRYCLRCAFDFTGLRKRGVPETRPDVVSFDLAAVAHWLAVPRMAAVAVAGA